MGEALRREDLPVNLPAGWDFAKLFGQPADARPAQLGGTGGAEQELRLPKTGTDAGLSLLLGAALASLAICGLLVLGRRQRLVR